MIMKKMLTHAVSYHGRNVEGEIKIERKVGRLSQLQQWYTNQPPFLDLIITLKKGETLFLRLV